MKFNVGDKVRVLKHLVGTTKDGTIAVPNYYYMDDSYHFQFYVPRTMKKFLGKVVTITGATEDGYTIKGCPHRFTDGMLEHEPVEVASR